MVALLRLFSRRRVLGRERRLDNETPRVVAGRLSQADYAANFADLTKPFDKHEAIVAAERCLFCYDAPCVTACPTDIDVPLFIREIAGGNRLGAAKTILGANIFGGMCARVCPTETLCEEACVRTAEGAPIEIGRLQRYATDIVLERDIRIFSRAPDTGRKIAVVGAGPAGLACAHALAVAGHAVTVFDAREKPAGLNEYGIAAYKTVDDFAAREVEWILSIGGIVTKPGVRLGRDIALADLRRDYHAVFLALGLGGTNALNMPGDDAMGVVEAVTYIEQLRQAPDKGVLPVGDRVVVIGGGMTAIDVATQVKKLGARDVTIAYRRGVADMKASTFEQELAQTSGVVIRHHATPVAIEAVDGHVSAVAFMMRDPLTDMTQRAVLPCDQLFLAIGQQFSPADAGESSLVLKSGRILVDDERRTSLPGVWAGGDCVANGYDLTVAAVQDGKCAAMSIDAALQAAS